MPKKLTLADVMAWDVDKFNRANTQELHEALKVLTAASNRRIKAIRDAGINDTPALSKLGRRTHFYSNQKNLNAMRSEFARAKNFLSNKTSTVRGYRSMIDKVNKGLKKNKVTVVTVDKTKLPYNRTAERQEEINNEHLWRAYEQLKERNPQIAEKQLKYAVLDSINKAIDEKPNRNITQLVNKIQKELDAIYQEELDTIERVTDTFTSV